MSTPKRKKMYIPKNLRWACDYDYLHKLSPKDREYYMKFVNEFYCGSVKKGDKTALHNTDVLRKDVYTRKNAANRDLLSISKSAGLVSSLNANSGETKMTTPDDLRRRQEMESYADLWEYLAKQRPKC
jgi:hypothetical protein